MDFGMPGHSNHGHVAELMEGSCGLLFDVQSRLIYPDLLQPSRRQPQQLWVHYP